MPRKRKKKVVPAGTVEAWGLHATRPDAGGLLAWPTLNPREEVTRWDMQRLYRSARALAYNSGAIWRAVEYCVNAQGWLLPQPCTPDEDWNAEARKHFMRLASKPRLFDQSGALNFITAQLWLETNRAIDGDVLVVAGRYKDFPCFSFYRAPQVSTDGSGGSDEDSGVITNARGRAEAYKLYDYATGKCTVVPASAAWLYRHHPDPATARGVTDLVRGVNAARDLMELSGYVKASAKLSAAIGLVETKKETDKAPGMMGNFGLTAASEPMGDGQRSLFTRMMGGAQIVSLGAGRDVKVISDNRPGPNTLSFMEKIKEEVADGIGLPADILYSAGKLGSAGVRLDLADVARWVEKRHHWRKPMLAWMWNYYMAAEIAAGRLRAPREGSFAEVYWVPCRDMTIDVGRVASASINLVREGLMSPAAFTLASEGKLPEDIAREKARLLAKIHKLEEEFGLPHGVLHQSALGATDVGAVVTSGGDEASDNSGL